VVITRGSTYDNRENLAAAFFDTIASKLEGTRLGRQELNAELLEDTPGALWQLEWIDRDRLTVAPQEFTRVVVAVDPATSTNEGSDETGIIVVAIGKEGHGYILEDLSGKYQPHEWAAKAIAAYRRHKADRAARARSKSEVKEHI
jgi:phage terminase large subunit-like protein